MQVNIEFNELNKNANGGTELMQRGLMQRLPVDLTDQFQIICSRVREVDTKKIPVLWLHDMWTDPEAQHLQKEESRKRFAAFCFVSYWQQYGYNIGLGVPYAGSYLFRNAIEPIPMHKKPNDGVVNFIYHTTPHRGLELLVPVFEKLAETFPNIHLDVYSSFKAYGWDQRDEDYQVLFDRIRSHKNMSYHGYQPNDVVREALKKAHVFAYPCTWLETSCISVIEALSSGCHVVCPSYGALPETCGHFATTYAYCEDFNIHANVFYHQLLEVMQSFQSDKTFFEGNMGVQKSYFDTYYNWDLRASQWKGFLEALSANVKQG